MSSQGSGAEAEMQLTERSIDWLRENRRAKSPPAAFAFAFFGLHHRHLIYFPGFVIRGPLTHLLAVQEVTRTQLGSVFPKPFPITGGRPLGQFPFSPDAAIFVVVDVFVLFCFFAGHLMTSLDRFSSAEHRRQ